MLCYETIVLGLSFLSAGLVEMVINIRRLFIQQTPSLTLAKRLARSSGCSLMTWAHIRKVETARLEAILQASKPAERCTLPPA
jgi:hypothetical protein